MDVMMNEPGPHCLVWLPLLHRLGSVENGNFLFRQFWYSSEFKKLQFN